MQEKLRNNIYRTTLVCIDSCREDVPEGRLFNPALEEPVPFHGVMGLLNQMERLLDLTNVPTAFAQMRSFQKPADGGVPQAASLRLQKGELATFELRILFRQNSSWQGSLIWLERDQEQNFRSVMELLFLMQSVWRGTPEDTPPEGGE